MLSECPFNTNILGAIGTGLIIGSSTGLVRGTASKWNRGKGLQNRFFARRARWLAYWLYRPWYVYG